MSDLPAGSGGLAVRLLGPVEISAGGWRCEHMPLGLRVLLSVLALSANRVVAAGALIEALWGEEASRARSGTCTRRCTSCGGGWPNWSQAPARNGWSPPRRGTGWCWGLVSWTWRCSRRWPPAAAPRCGRGWPAAAARSSREGCWARRWGCGAGRPWPMSRRPAGGWKPRPRCWRNSGWRSPKTAPAPTWPPGCTSSSPPNSPAWPGSTRYGNGCAGC